MKPIAFVVSASITLALAGCGNNEHEQLAGAQARAHKMESAAIAPGASILTIAGYRNNFNIINNAGVVTISSRLDAQDVRTYTGLKLIKFVDQFVDFDVNGTAGQVYRLYQAAFGRKPDIAGLGFWIAATAGGARTLDSVALEFSQSAEFQSLYGVNATNDKLVASVYFNVLHRQPEQAGLEFWLDAMKKGLSVQSLLTSFSESDENKRNVNPGMVNGFHYVPFQRGGPIVPMTTSYANAKQGGLPPVSLPVEEEWAAAYARADFKGDGTISLFSAHRTYDNRLPLSQATPGVMGFYSKGGDGKWVKEPGMIDTTVSCIEPRKALVADFNADGRPDVLLACTGYDAFPFPGEKMILVKSAPGAMYQTHAVGDFLGYFHGAAAADLDGDGLIDLVTTDNKPGTQLRMFRNKGKGEFEEVFDAFPAMPRNAGYFTMELVDLNDDNRLDLLVGGHEFEGTATTVLYGDGTATFARAKVRDLPGVDASAGVVLDFLKLGNKLYVGRTNGGASGFYAKIGMQVVDLTTWTTETVTTRDAPLFIWLLPSGNGVVSDRTDRPL